MKTLPMLQAILLCVSLFLFSEVLRATTCTPIPVTVCTTVSYKQKNGGVTSFKAGHECHTTYYWDCDYGDGSQGGGGGGSDPGGEPSGAPDDGTGGGNENAGFPNRDKVVDCLQGIIHHQGIIGTYNEPRGTGPHSGLDLAAPNGTQICSPVSGRVRQVIDGIPTGRNITQDPGFFIGNQIVIDVDDAWITDSHGNDVEIKDGAVTRIILDHLDLGVSVAQGQQIQRGDKIARSDNTGNTNIDPHLHITVYRKVDGVIDTVDPQTIFTKDNCN
jgi:murein DD-endopeptidase MepM/ murein hydrolase activator NlpD